MMDEDDDDANIGNGDDNGDFQVRPTPLYAVLVCGLIVAAIGLYLTVTNQFLGGTEGLIRLGRRLQGSYSYSGPSLLILGLLVCVYPVYQLRKNSRKDRIR